MSQIKTTEIEGDVAVGRHVNAGGNALIQGNTTVKKNLKVEGWLDAKNIKGPCKGLFLSEERLIAEFPYPHVGWWAFVGSTLPAAVYIAQGNEWVATGETAGSPTIDGQQYNDVTFEGLRQDIEAIRQGITDVDEKADTLSSTIDALIGSNASDAIENFNEIVSFLDGLKDSDKLGVKLADMANSHADLKEIVDYLSVRVGGHEESYQVVEDDNISLDDYSEDGIYFFKADSSVLIVKSQLVNGQMNGAYRVAIMQYSFSVGGLRYRGGSVVRKVTPEDVTTLTWSEWRTFDFVHQSERVADLESALHIVNDESFSEAADSLVEPGLYFFPELGDCVLVSALDLSDGYTPIRQYHFTSHKIDCRRGTINEGEVTWYEWQDYLSDISKSVHKLYCGISPIQGYSLSDSQLEYYSYPGLFFFKDNTVLLTQHGDLINTDGDGFSHYKAAQYLFTADGIRSRKGVYSSENYLDDHDLDTCEWGEWERVGDIVKVVVDDEYHGVSELTDEGCHVTIGGEDASLTVSCSEQLGGDHESHTAKLHKLAITPDGLKKRSIFVEYNHEDGSSEMYNSTDWEDVYSPAIINILWANLKSLRDNSKLVPGHWYRITDFVTTVANDPCAQSAGHRFDLLVLATSNRTLSEEARAVKSDSDTSNYFDWSKLEAWKVWYCLDNDTTRFAWADTVNGKGVIYRLIDEWGNDCPYDFKNVMFSRYFVDGHISGFPPMTLSPYGLFLPTESPVFIETAAPKFWFEKMDDTPVMLFTFCYAFDNTLMVGKHDASLSDPCLYNPENVTELCHHNRILPAYSEQKIDGLYFRTQYLNNIVFASYSHDAIANNVIDTNCYNMTYFGKTATLSIGSDCHDIYGVDDESISVESDCMFIFLGVRSESVKIGRSCANIAITADSKDIVISYYTGSIAIDRSDSIMINGSVVETNIIQSSNINIDSDCHSIVLAESNDIHIGSACNSIELNGCSNIDVSYGCTYTYVYGRNIEIGTLCKYLTVTNPKVQGTCLKVLPLTIGAGPSSSARLQINLSGSPLSGYLVAYYSDGSVQYKSPGEVG